jgi:hypothetical protein
MSPCTGAAEQRSRLVLVCLAATACAPRDVLSPSWEPTSPLVPASRDRASAALHLDQSRRLWERRNFQTGRMFEFEPDTPWHHERYSYIRGYEWSHDHVDFTVIAVNHDKVVCARSSAPISNASEPSRAAECVSDI